MKKILSIALIAVLLISGLFILTGCGDEGKKNTVEISDTLGKGKITVSVPKNEDGEAKYQFTTDKPEGTQRSGSIYLETDNAVFVFSTSGLVYNTSIYYEQKYGEKEATFDGYLEWANDKDSGIRLHGMEQIEINGRKAVKYDYLEGASNNYTYYGYNYMIGVDDIYKGSHFDVNVTLSKDGESSAPEIDEETQAIIDSLVISLNE